MFNSIGQLIALGISSTLASDLQQVIQQLFQLFGEFVSYIMNAPAIGWWTLSLGFANAVEQDGNLIPIVLTIVFGITGMIAYTVLSISKSIEEFASPEFLMEES